MSCTILFTAGAKGGSGKSTAVRFVVTYLRERGIDPLLIDLDDENQTLFRFFPEALRVPITKRSAHDVLIEKAIAGQHLPIVADLKAGTGREVLDWFLDVPFEDLSNRGVHFICLGSITSSPDSVQSFLTWVAALQDRVSYVVFKNLKDGEYLPDYEETAEAVEFRQSFKPLEITIPRLDHEYQTELERLNLTISEVLDSNDGISARGKIIGPILSRLMVRSRLRRFQRTIYEQLDGLRVVLLPRLDLDKRSAATSSEDDSNLMDAASLGGEPLEDSGFEEESPDDAFGWRA